MKLEKVLERIAAARSGNDESRCAARFLYGDDVSIKRTLRPAASELLRSPPFNEDGYKRIRHDGDNTLVIGNDKVVFKLETGRNSFEGHEYPLPAGEVPTSLTADIIASGECNGVGYALCERIHTNALRRLKKSSRFFSRPATWVSLIGTPSPPISDMIAMGN